MNAPHLKIPGSSATLAGTEVGDDHRATDRARFRSTWLVLQPDDEVPGVFPPVSPPGAIWWRSLRLPGPGAKQRRASLFARILRGR